MNDRNMEIMNDLRSGFLPVLVFEANRINNAVDEKISELKALAEDFKIAKDQSSESVEDNNYIQLLLMKDRQIRTQIEELSKKANKMSVYELPVSSEEVTLGSIIELKYLSDGIIEKVLITGEHCSDYKDENISCVASVESPIFGALIGKKVGARANVIISNKNTLEVEILKINTVCANFNTV